jgi:RNA polymerase sigma factor (TIGR02999 family)
MNSIENKGTVEPKEVGEITRILQTWNEGDGEAVDRLMAYVVNELRQIARKNLRRYTQGSSDTLQPTVLVNETYLKLRNVKHPHLTERADFYALCAEIIKHIIIDYTRRKRAASRGGGQEAVPLDDVLNLSWIRNGKNSSAEDLVLFNEVMGRLEAKYRRESQVLGLKYYVGLTDDEIAKTLRVSVPTVRRDLTFAVAWFRREVDAVTSEIFKQASDIKDAAARKEYLEEACAGSAALLKDVELLLKKARTEGKTSRDSG